MKVNKQTKDSWRRLGSHTVNISGQPGRCYNAFSHPSFPLSIFLSAWDPRGTHLPTRERRWWGDGWENAKKHFPWATEPQTCSARLIYIYIYIYDLGLSLLTPILTQSRGFPWTVGTKSFISTNSCRESLLDLKVTVEMISLSFRSFPYE